MAVQARAWDPGLLDDLSDRAPRVAQMSCPFQFPCVDQHRSADTTALRGGHRPRVAARSIVYVRSICPNSASSTTASCAIGSSGLLESTLIGSARFRTPILRSASSWIKFKVSRTVRPTDRAVHDDHVPLARVRDDLSEPGPVRRRAGLPVDVDPVARDPDLFERVDLPIEILLHRLHGYFGWTLAIGCSSTPVSGPARVDQPTPG